jgi:membrane associated rhomboid family serine protease
MATIAITLLTVLISFLAFNDRNLVNKLIFYPYGMNNNPKEWYRFITHGFIHADYAHLIFNCIALFSFGSNIEREIGTPLFVIFYFSALILASLGNYFAKKEWGTYASLGASGAVSAIIFASILRDPWSGIYLYFIKVPAIVFGVLYLVYTYYMVKKGQDKIDHRAHFDGAIYGIAFILIAMPGTFTRFITLIQHPEMYQM